MNPDDKKYRPVENVLTKINEKIVALNNGELKRNKDILEQVTNTIIDKMKLTDSLFDALYEKKFYGGSVYDSLKVGKPEEYDIDLIMNLPSNLEVNVNVSDIPGFVKILISSFDDFLKTTTYAKYKGIEKIIEDKFLSVAKVLQWMEGILSNVFKQFDVNESKKSTIPIRKDGVEYTFIVEMKKQHPAFTLKLTGEMNDEKVSFDVDLVPSFQFSENKWPGKEYRKNTSKTKKNFLIVPKLPKNTDLKNTNTYWRLSFQEQERELLKSNNLNRLKPCIRLLKQLRDNQKHAKIASYYIKTVFLWELLANNNDNIWNQPLIIVFMKMLTRYTDMICNKNIPYFWNSKNNLIAHISPQTCTDIGNRLRKILKTIESNVEGDPLCITKFFVSESELSAINEDVNLSKKCKIPNNLLSEPCNISTINAGVSTTTSVNTVSSCPNCVQDLNKKIDQLSEKVDRLISLMSNLEEYTKSKFCVLEDKLHFINMKMKESYLVKVSETTEVHSYEG